MNNMLLYEIVLTKSDEIYINKYTSQQIASLDGVKRFRLFEFPDGACIKTVSEQDILNPDSLMNVYVYSEKDVPEAKASLIDRNISALQHRITQLEKAKEMRF